MATAAQKAAPDLVYEPVDLGGRCEILPGSRLPDLDSPAGPSFVTRSKRERRTELFATIVETPVPARIEVLATLRGLEHPHILRVVDWGTVTWPLESRRRFAIVFERPAGRRLMDTLSDVRDPMGEDVIVRQIMPAMLSCLKDLGSRGITCGAVRPTNLFFRDPAAGGILLGDCVSVPPGYAQPLLFEPAERAMAQPSGRGPGTIGDDLYALGITLLILAVGRNPVRALDDESLLQSKIDRGTYITLASGVRLPQTLIEPLRGLTIDDPRQRWTVQDLDLWLQGRRLTPKQASTIKRAGRPFELNGQEMYHCRPLARALAAQPAVAAQIIERGDLDKWLRRSLSDDARAEAVQAAIESAGAGTRPASLEDRVVARTCIALDPAAPIRYKGRVVMPDGIGTALAEAVATGGGGQQSIAEILLAQLPMFWVSSQVDFRPEHVPMVQSFDYMRTLLEQTGPGFGLERVLYEMNPALHCLSPQIADQHALTLSDLLLALDTVATSPVHGRDPMDRHVAAFIATHHKRLNDRLLNPLAAVGDNTRRLIATLSILADVQSRYGPSSLPNLCQWLVSLLDPALKRFKNRRTRDRIKQEAQRLARDGSLEALLKLLDDPQTLKADERGFMQAMQKHETLTRQIDKLKRGIDNRGVIAEGTGRQIAAVASSVIAMAMLIVIVLLMAGTP